MLNILINRDVSIKIALTGRHPLVPLPNLNEIQIARAADQSVIRSGRRRWLANQSVALHLPRQRMWHELHAPAQAYNYYAA